MKDVWLKITQGLGSIQRIWAALGKSSANRQPAGGSKSESRAAKRRARVALVKDRPSTLEDRYHLIEHEELADEIFGRVKRRVVEAVQAEQRRERQANSMIEAGRIAPGRPYFFLKPLGRTGWLFERSGAGWVVSRAEKIVANDLFLREGSPIDTVSLYMARDQQGFPRVRSQVFQGDLLSLAVYEQRLLAQIGLSSGSHGRVS